MKRVTKPRICVTRTRYARPASSFPKLFQRLGESDADFQRRYIEEFCRLNRLKVTDLPQPGVGSDTTND